MNMLLDLANSYYKDDGTLKPAHYFQVYEEFLGSLRDKPIRLLELGVASGASMRVWRDYFESADLVGFDICPMPQLIADEVAAGRICFVQGDQTSPDDLARCLEGGSFDVIIDDASHIGAWSKITFEMLFNEGLKPGGLYFIEDYGIGYNGTFYDGSQIVRSAWNKDTKEFPSHASGMVGWVKQLIDEMHAPFILPRATRILSIASIQFWPSIALVRKAA